MSKLKLQMQLSVDGYVAGPNGEMDWMTWNHDAELMQYITDLTDTIGTIVMGRKLAEGFIPYWANAAKNPNDPSHPFAHKMADKPKVVFTKTMDRSVWDNTEIATGDVTDEINKLKNSEGKDIIAYGGAGFVSSLIKNNLIDEYHLFINPTAIGNGMAIFKDVEQKLKLKLVKASPFSCGIVVLTYQPADR